MKQPVTKLHPKEAWPFPKTVPPVKPKKQTPQQFLKTLKESPL